VSLVRVLINTALTVPPARIVLNNQEYLTAPAVLVVSGVLNGGLVPGEELHAEDWNGVAITVGHPLDAAGTPLSARQPDVIASCGVGRVYRARLSTGQRGSQRVPSLQAELWINLAEAQACGEEAMQAVQMLEAQQPLEISTAFYCESERATGSAYGMPYTEIHRNLHPDHLALLPNDVGACSWTNGGCGAPRLNQRAACACAACAERSPMQPPSPTTWQAFVQAMRQLFVPSHEAAATATPTLVAHGESLAAALNRLIDGRVTEQRSRAAIIQAMASEADIQPSTVTQILSASITCPPLARLEGFARALDVSVAQLRRAAASDGCEYPTTNAQQELAPVHDLAAALALNQTDADVREALYGALAREMGQDFTPIYIDAIDTANQSFTYRQGERLRMRSWQMEGEVLQLADDAQDVQRSTSYIPVESAPVTQQQQEDPQPMPTPQTSPIAIKARVNALIADPLSAWKEKDRPILENFSEAALIRLEAQPKDVPAIVVPVPEPPATLAEAIATLPAHLREPMQVMAQEHQARKTAAIAALIGNKNCPFPQEKLQEFAVQELEALVAGFAGVDYSGKGLPPERQAPEVREQPPAPPDTLGGVLARQKALGMRA
jgi:hypothetical protein